MNLLAAIAGAGGQYFYKKGADHITQGGSPVNMNIFIGVLLFCGVMAFFIVGYKMGGRISVVYPFYATTFIWGTMIGIFIEKEPWNPLMLLGLLMVVAGTSIIAVSAGRVS